MSATGVGMQSVRRSPQKDAQMTILYGFPPAFGCMSPSPFVMKTDIQLQMLGVSFERRIANLDAVAKHKAPYVDDGGEIVEDSTFIRWHF